ncbi:hypothetical protein GCM10010964_20620 [Caldovatus sediminis]|uniref:Uncharacterized protein n=1 Tax=Caldovatus sediminis TaxID=2041189 RepID=A0A8J3EDP7_9PROT|nr:hypothetical protein GCM10010964_20620 [Caldovatus sediminis]
MGKTENSAGLGEKRRLAPVGFDQVDRSFRDQGEYEAGEAGTGAEIDKWAPDGQQGPELQGIDDVSPFDRTFVALCDEIDPPVPIQQ